MDDNLNRVESAVSATSSGNLTWERWPHDVATALGFAGQRNPLGFAVVRYLAEPPSSVSVWNIVLVLAKCLEDQGVDGAVSKEAACRGLDFWRDRRCLSCHGRGHVGDAHHQCPSCGGSGHRRMPDGPEPVRAAISALIDAEQRMEGQLRARLKGATAAVDVSDGYRLCLPEKGGAWVGTGGSPVTPKAPGQE